MSVLAPVNDDWLRVLAADDARTLTQPTDGLCVRCHRRLQLIGHNTCWPCRDVDLHRFHDEGANPDEDLALGREP